MDSFKNIIGMKKPSGSNVNMRDYSRHIQNQQYRNDEYSKVTKQDVDSLKLMLAEMGMESDFTDLQIMKALKFNNYNFEKAMDQLLSGGIEEINQGQVQKANSLNVPAPLPMGHKQGGQSPSNSSNKSKNNKDLVSNPFMNQQLIQNNTLKKAEPVPKNERYRDYNIPAGLKNVGNTCYFASLMQVLFHLPNIQEKILCFNPQRFPEQWAKIDEAKMEEVEKIKLQKSRDLVKEMKNMFAKMLLSNVKYQDPTKVLESIVDDNGVGISIYEQKDIGEFFLNFLDRMQDGLCENKLIIRKLMSNDLAHNINEKKDAKIGQVIQPSINNYDDDMQTSEQFAFEDNQKREDAQRQSIGPEGFKDFNNPQDTNFSMPSGQGQSDLGEINDQNMDNAIDQYHNNPRRDGGAQMASLYFNSKNKSQFMRTQSIIDPDKDAILLDYNLEEFKNSMWENFLGSQVQISKIIDEDGTQKITNRNIDKMGPVQLRIEEDNLYQAWEKSRRSEIEGFKGDKPGQKKELETWICRPPNVMMFQLNRVQFDMEKLKLVKDNSKFEFDKEIYLDLFLNQNKERSDLHRAELEVMKKKLKVLKEEQQVILKNDIVQKIKDCRDFIAFNTAHEMQGTCSEPDPNIPNNSKLNLVISDKDSFITQQVLGQFENAQEQQVQSLKLKIAELEMQVESPYIKNKEQPYQLHAIMIHDGMAENGHYYTYIFDRKMKVWWQMNDHQAIQVDEEKVMQEALGNSKQYKSACNLFYINKHISDQIDQLQSPVFTEKNAQNLKISKDLRDSILKQNYAFELEVQNYVITQVVEKIISITKERLSKLDNQEQNLDSIVQLKLYSFVHFLRNVEFKGYSKWCVLNQVVKELHPQNLNLEQIIEDMSNDKTPRQGDDIYQGLLTYYPDKFMQLTPNEQKSLQQKQTEFKSLLKKSVFLTYMFINMKPNKLRNVFNAYNIFKKYCQDLKNNINNYNRIDDFDAMSFEIVQIFVFNLLINILWKFRSSKQHKRKDAQISAWVASIIIHQFFDKKKAHFKQLEYILGEVVTFNKKIKGAKENYISQNEMDFYVDQLQRLRKGQYNDNELIHLDDNLPEEIEKQFKEIDQLDCMEFVDGIDTESNSFKYFNSLNQFRFEYIGQINLQSIWIQKAPWTEQNMLHFVQKHQIQLPTLLFEPEFNIKSLIGRQNV